MTQSAAWTNKPLGPYLPSFNQLDQAKCVVERAFRIAQGALGLACFLGYNPRAFDCAKVTRFLDDFRMCIFACDLPVTLLRFTESSQGKSSIIKLLELFASFTVDIALFASCWEDQLPRIISSLKGNPSKLPAFPTADLLAQAMNPCLTLIYALDAIEKCKDWSTQPSTETRLSLGKSMADLTADILPKGFQKATTKTVEDLFNVATGTLGTYTLWKTFPKAA